jgi:hypothetical protein
MINLKEKVIILFSCKLMIRLLWIAHAFANYFKTIFSTACPTQTPQFLTSDFSSTASISAAEVNGAINRFKPPQSIGVDEIPSFVIKVFSHIFTSLLTFILILAYVVRYFHPFGNYSFQSI